MERKEIMKEIIDEKNNKIIGNINLDNSKVKFTGRSRERKNFKSKSRCKGGNI